MLVVQIGVLGAGVSPCRQLWSETACTAAKEKQKHADDAQIWHRLLSAASSEESRSSGEGCLPRLEMTTRWQ